MEIIISTIFAILLILIQKSQKNITNPLILSYIKEYNINTNKRIRTFLKLKKYSPKNRVYNFSLIFIAIMLFLYILKCHNNDFLLNILFIIFFITVSKSNFIDIIKKIKNIFILFFTLFATVSKNNFIDIIKNIFYRLKLILKNPTHFLKKAIFSYNFISIIILMTIIFITSDIFKNIIDDSLSSLSSLLFILLVLLTLLLLFILVLLFILIFPFLASKFILYPIIRYFFKGVFYLNKKEPMKPTILIIEVSNYIILAIILYDRV